MSPKAKVGYCFDVLPRFEKYECHHVLKEFLAASSTTIRVSFKILPIWHYKILNEYANLYALLLKPVFLPIDICEW